MTHADALELRDLADDAAREAGKLALEHYGEDVEAWQKGDKTPVTKTDLAVDKMLRERLTAARPDFGWLSEETHDDLARLDKRDVWIVDPIDGTRNFAKGRPVFAVMLALVQKGVTLASWIYELPEGRMAVAERGSGAWRDEQRLSVAQPPAKVSEMAGTLHASTWGQPEVARSLERNRSKITQMKSLGCAGAEYVRLAAGEMDFSLFTKLMPWDHAPGALLHAEAGGLAKVLEGERYSPLMRKTQGLLMAADEETWETLRHTLFD